MISEINRELIPLNSAGAVEERYSQSKIISGPRGLALLQHIFNTALIFAKHVLILDQA